MLLKEAKYLSQHECPKDSYEEVGALTILTFQIGNHLLSKIQPIKDWKISADQ